MVLLEVGKQGFQGVEFGLDDAQAREELGVRFRLGRCRSVRHERNVADKSYRRLNSLIGGPTGGALLGS
jgi:hypothetical protein